MPADSDQQRAAAIARGLKWLAGRQEEDGNWLFATAPNPGDRAERVGATSLALLPFLQAGNTHKDGRYEKVVAKGIRHIGRQGKLNPETGLDLRGEGGNMYTHALATIVLCEAQARTRDRLLRKPAAGSWFVEGPRDLNFVAATAGRLGVTAFCLMTLQELNEPSAKTR